MIRISVSHIKPRERERIVRPWPPAHIELPRHPRVYRGYRYRGRAKA